MRLMKEILRLLNKDILANVFNIFSSCHWVVFPYSITSFTI